MQHNVCFNANNFILFIKFFLAELGDYSPDEHKEDYLDNFNIIPHQSASLTRVISQYHRRHNGKFPADAEYKFLEIAKTLPLYGFDLYEAKVIFFKNFCFSYYFLSFLGQ